MNKGITSSKFNEGPKAYRLKRDKMPVIPFLSLSSGSRSRKRKGAKGAPRRATSGRKHQENISVAVQRLAGDDSAGERARRRGGRTSIRDEGIGARVLRLDGLPSRPLPLPQPPNACRPRRRPREVQGAGNADDGVAGAARSGAQCLVGPVILPPATLIVAAAVLLATLARGGIFIVRRALHAAPYASPEVPEDLDGEEATLH